jgi:hypothetical protein
MRALLVILLVITISGCFSGPAPTPGLPVDAKGKVLPTVHGFVVDEAIRPMEGVRIHFLGTNVSTYSDKNGAYALHDPVTQFHQALVVAFKPGFLPRTQQVQVSGKISARLDFGLQINPHSVPHTEVLDHRGMARCDGRITAAGQQFGIDCQGGPSRDGDPPPSWMWEITPTPNFAGAVLQIHWNPAYPDSERLHIWLLGRVAGGIGGELWANVTQGSPVRLEVTEQQARAMPEWTALRLHVDLAETGGPIPGATAVVARDQLYQAIATVFYVNPAPPGYVVT